MKKTKMCCSLWTTFSVSPKPVLKCPPFLDVFLLLSVTSPLLPLIWVVFKNVLPLPPRDPLPLCKLSTCRLMILRILPLPQPLLTWTLQLCCPVLLLSWVSTPLSIPLIPLPVCLTPALSEWSTTKLPVLPKSFSRITSLCKISLPFLVWMNFLKMISLLSLVLVRCKNSCLNLSMLPKFSLVPRVSSFLWTTPSKGSRKSLLANMMTCRRVLSTWSEILLMFRRRPPVWRCKMLLQGLLR
mmetsp:Transcript_35100/g.73104  ORF Transcript_35100/g.73104 Transcript_35100/m.73104 type:complete len:241 (-) Transcript_35100:79-801(-)